MSLIGPLIRSSSKMGSPLLPLNRVDATVPATAAPTPVSGELNIPAPKDEAAFPPTLISWFSTIDPPLIAIWEPWTNSPAPYVPATDAETNGFVKEIEDCPSA